MSLVFLNNDWKRYGNGRIWRCQKPSFIMELDREGNSPNYMHLQSSVTSIRKIKAFYTGKLALGTLDVNTNGVDILVANAMTESFGSVPTQFSDELSKVYANAPGILVGDKLAAVVDYIKIRNKNLVRKEPGYINPISTPEKISVGAHHCLISTALNLGGMYTFTKSSPKYIEAVKDLIFKLPSTSAFAAQLAIKYFNNTYSKHHNEPPLLAASYNAGSLRPDASNAWNLKQYGNHLDRWVAFYNTSRMLSVHTAVIDKEIAKPTPKPIPIPDKTKPLEIKVIRKEFTQESTIGELYVNEEFHCYTLEDVERADGAQKVFGKTAIPKGRYKLIVNMSNRFKKEMPLLINVAGFDGVRIHAGNTAADTLGCVLVGKSKAANKIYNCGGVFTSLVDKIKAGTANSECYITIQHK
jgi:Family of unknown function (DUF5675)